MMDTLVLAAYIDPGSGSIIFQALVAGVMAVGFTTRMYWHKLKSVFRRSQR